MVPLLLAVVAAGCPFRDTGADVADKTRADATEPRAHLRAHSAQSIRVKLNAHLQSNPTVGYPVGKAAPCANFTVEELDAVQASLDACAADSVTSRMGDVRFFF